MSTHNIPFSMIKKKISLNYPKSAAIGFSQETQEEFLTAVVNGPSVFEPLKLYFICIDDNCTWYYQKEDYGH